MYSEEEELIGSAVNKEDGVKELLETSEELGNILTEWTGLVESIKLADADTSPEGEEVIELPSDIVVQAERVAVENTSDTLVVIEEDIEGELLIDSTPLYETNGVDDASMDAEPILLAVVKGPLTLAKGLAESSEEPLGSADEE